MKNLNKLIGVSFIMVFLMISCDDILEEDITDDFILLDTPEDGLIIETEALLFSWNDLDGVDDYQFQLRNQETGIIVIDSLVVDNFLDLELDPQVYSWRVKGINFAYETEFTFPREVTVLLPNGLSNQSITLLCPENEVFFNAASSLLFNWELLEDADEYEISIDRDVNGVFTNEILETEIENPPFSVDISSFENDGVYQWSIMALNDNSEASSIERIFFIDRELPNLVDLTLPEADTEFVIDEEITFSWSIPEDTGIVQSQIEHFLQISDSETFDNIIQSDNTLENNSIIFGIQEAGEYWWRLRSIDQAGNESDYSEGRRFVVE